MDAVGIVLIGLLGGVLAGMFGVGGGVVYVPALVVFADLGVLEAEATSLLAMIPVALVGAARQRTYGNVRVRDALVLGVLAIGGGVAGVVAANAVGERALEVAFACLMLVIAAQLARRALQE